MQWPSSRGIVRVAARVAAPLVLVPAVLAAQGPSLRVGVQPPERVAAARTGRPTPPNQYVLRSWSWGNGFVLSAFGGELDLSRSVKPGGQDLIGASVGFVFGHGTTLRGYYWKGITSGWDDTEPIQSYGGEAQLDLVGAGPVRFVVLGGVGFLDFDEGYVNADSLRPKDTGYAIGGVGLVVEPLKWLRFDFTARDYFIKVPLGIEGEESPVEDRSIKSNIMFSGGVTVRLGGTPGADKPPGLGSGAAGGVAATSAIVPAPVDGGEIRVIYRGRDSALAAALGVPVDSAGLVVVTTAAAASMLRAVLASELGYLDGLFPETAPLGQPRTPVSGARLDTLTARMRLRVNDVFDHLAVEEAAAMRVALAEELARRNITGDAAQKVLASAEAILIERTRMLREDSRALRAREDTLAARLQAELARRPSGAGYIGPSFGGDFQFIVGGQVGLRSPVRRLSIVPEAALGFGAGTSALIGIGGHYTLKTTGTTRPYVGLGLALLVVSRPLGDIEGSNFVVTPKLGVTIDSDGAKSLFGSRATGWLIEYQGVDFFSLNRLLFGVRWRL